MSISMLLHKHHNASQNHDSSGNLLDFFNQIQIYVTVRHQHQPPHFSDHGGRGGHALSGEALRGL